MKRMSQSQSFKTPKKNIQAFVVKKERQNQQKNQGFFWMAKQAKTIKISHCA